MPRLRVNRETSVPFASSLIHESSCVIENSQHGNNSIRMTIGSTDRWKNHWGGKGRRFFENLFGPAEVARKGRERKSKKF